MIEVNQSHINEWTAAEIRTPGAVIRASQDERMGTPATVEINFGRIEEAETGRLGSKIVVKFPSISVIDGKVTNVVILIPDDGQSMRAVRDAMTHFRR